MLITTNPRPLDPQIFQPIVSCFEKNGTRKKVFLQCLVLERDMQTGKLFFKKRFPPHNIIRLFLWGCG